MRYYRSQFSIRPEDEGHIQSELRNHLYGYLARLSLPKRTEFYVNWKMRHGAESTDQLKAPVNERLLRQERQHRKTLVPRQSAPALETVVDDDLEPVKPESEKPPDKGIKRKKTSGPRLMGMIS